MQTNHITRRFEFALVLTATAGYLANSLSYDARNFESKIEEAIGSGVSVRTILNDLSHYDHTWNHNMPVIVAGVMTFIAWVLFHYILFPKIQEKKTSAYELTLMALIGGLLLSATFVWLNSIDVVFRRDALEQIIGLRDVSHYRKLFLLSDSIAIFTLICFYETLSQLYYKLVKKLESEPNGKFLQYAILILTCGIVFMLVLSQRLVSNILLSIAIRQFLAVVLFVLIAYFMQDYYFRKVHQLMHNPSLAPEASLPLFAFMLISFLGIGLIWGIMARFHINSIILIIFSGIGFFVVSLTTSYYRKNVQKEKAVLTAEVSNKSAELSNLRSQINPHFLFNALNSLYATALSENSEKTAEGIQKLGDMMRFMLHENNHDRIALTSEIAYLHNYIDIQRMRLDETQNIEIRVNMQQPSTDVYIAPMLLSPFIENAFKHGISLQNPSWIFITLTLDEAHIYFKVHNSTHPHQLNDPEKNNSGIGLSNVEKRLKLIYPTRYNLNIQKSSQDYFASLTIRY